MNVKYDPLEETVFVFAARYAHNRNTAGAGAVIAALKANWKRFSGNTQMTLIKESMEASANKNEWALFRAWASE